MADKRVVAVLGYSARRGDGLHPVCAERLAHASELAPGALAVILSGWARRPRAVSEAELMRDAWTAADVEVVCDPDARSTAENVANVVADARRLGAEELVLVTSRWHRPRARLLLWAATRGRGLRGRVEVPTGSRWSSMAVRELAIVPLLPAQLLRARRNPSNE